MATTIKDYYKILSVGKDVDQNEIKKAYRKLARKYHPDLNPGNKTSEERFKEINEAYAVLGSSQRRAEYDKNKTFTFDSAFGGFEGSRGFDFADTFDFGDIFGDFFDIKGRAKSRYARGGDILMGISLTLEEAFSGITRSIPIKRTVNSSKGRAVHTESVKTKMPAGVDDGSVVRLKGLGNAGRGGGQAGDLLLKITVKPHPTFKRKGDDIYVRLPVTFGEAALGAKVEVPTIDGATIMKLPPGTQGGQKFKLSKKGFISFKSRTRGDEYVEIKIVIPRNIPENAKETINAIESLYKGDPRRGMK